MAAHWILINTDTKEEIKRSPRLPTIDQSMPKGMEKGLKWLPIKRGEYPSIDIKTQSIRFKEEIVNDELIITYLPFISNENTRSEEIKKEIKRR